MPVVNAAATAGAAQGGPAPLLVRVLRESDREAIAAHLCGLAPADRKLRFCHARSDEQLGAYVHQLDFSRDVVLGAAQQAHLVGVCHVGIGRALTACLRPN